MDLEAVSALRKLGHVGLLALGILVTGCGAATPSPQDVWEIDHFGPLEPGRYFIDPDGEPSTPLKVIFDIPAEGWSAWAGAAKFSDVGHSGVSITTVANLVRDGCVDHTWADPPVGPSVDELAAALASLAPFEVTSPPTDATIDGYIRIKP